MDSTTKTSPVFGATNPATPINPRAVRYASVIELVPHMEAKYRELHGAVWIEVVAAIKKANITDYYIHRAELGGKSYLFSSFTYTGLDFTADMKSIAEDPTTRDKWWPLCMECQQRLPGTPHGEQWLGLEQLMHIP
jgi:L-rhamnose mutarotase